METTSPQVSPSVEIVIQNKSPSSANELSPQPELETEPPAKRFKELLNQYVFCSKTFQN